MPVESFARVDPIVVVHQQDSVGVRRQIEVARRRKRLPGLEPFVALVMTFVGPDDGE